MTSALQSEVTKLLDRMNAGDPAASDQLLGILYSELHDLAAHYMRSQPPNHTLQATALVNEAFLRLNAPRKSPFKDRRHFVALAAKAMRCVLIDHARRKQRAKRSVEAEKVPLDQIIVSYEERAFGLLELDEALKKLASFDARMARAVELRFFGGLGVEETAEMLGMSRCRFEREWASTRTWLYLEVR